MKIKSMFSTPLMGWWKGLLSQTTLRPGKSRRQKTCSDNCCYLRSKNKNKNQMFPITQITRCNLKVVFSKFKQQHSYSIERKTWVLSSQVLRRSSQSTYLKTSLTRWRGSYMVDQHRGSRWQKKWKRQVGQKILSCKNGRYLLCQRRNRDHHGKSALHLFRTGCVFPQKHLSSNRYFEGVGSLELSQSLLKTCIMLSQTIKNNNLNINS